MRRSALAVVLLAPLLLAAGSAPIVSSGATIEQALALAAAEARQAEARVTALRAGERRARGEAARIAAERRTAAAEIDLAQSHLAAADASVMQARARLALAERQLARRRAPLAALLAGLTTMGRQPPVLTLADGASMREIVRVRALVDSTMPLIARRSEALQAELGRRRRLSEEMAEARLHSAELRADLARRVERFALLERRAMARAEKLGRDAFGAQDELISGSETLLDLEDRARDTAASRAAAHVLAAMPMSPPRPVGGEGGSPKAALAYILPTSAPVVEGLGEISPAGVRSRGLRFATSAGAQIVAPAAGTILFAGPFREHDGIVVIDHGRGWTSLIIAVSPQVRRGERIASGALLGRALGEITLELRQAGVPRSAALIAGSSPMLSKGRRNR